MKPISVMRCRNAYTLTVYTLAIGGILSSVLTVSLVAARQQQQVDSSASDQGSLTSYFNSARQLISNSLDAHNKAQTYSALMPNEDPRAAEMLRDTIEKTTDLIGDYRQDGLSNMPPVPNIPGLRSLMRLPDKLMRAELTMLQHGILMAQEMRERPISATMNMPKELMGMAARVAQQLNQ